MKSKSHGVCGDLKSFLVMDERVYFATIVNHGNDGRCVLSYDLITKSWIVLTTSLVWDLIYNLRPAFDPPIMLVGKIFFWGIWT